jgi:tetratricopeptide (TPR) repeat protein
MELGARAFAAILLTATASCSLLFGDRGGGGAPPPPAAPVSFRRIPELVRPSARDLARSAELCAAVEQVERREQLAAAIVFQRLHAGGRWGPEVAALHSWSLTDSGAPADGRRVARDGLAEHGPAPSLDYADAVAAELLGLPGEAYSAYLRASAARPGDATLLRACARTALAAGRADVALVHLDALPAPAGGDEDLDLARLRATAAAAGGRYADAVAIRERLTAAHPGDLALAAENAAAAAAAAESSANPGLLVRARRLAEALAGADPQHAEAHWIVGRLSAALGETAAAEAALRRTLELDPARVDAGLLLADLLDAAARKDEARALLFELLRQPLDRERIEAVQRRILRLEGA